MTPTIFGHRTYLAFVFKLIINFIILKTMQKILWQLTQLVLIPLILAGAFFIWSLPRITTDYNFNTDELIYLSRSSYWTAFKSGNYHDPIWWQWGSYDQPQLTNYLYAQVGVDPSLVDANNSPCSRKSTQDFYGTWACLDGPPLSTWPSSLDSLKALVIRARTIATGISAVAVATTYFLGLVVAGPVTGVIAAIYLGWFSFFKNLATMAMMDQILLVFLNLQFIFALLAIKHKKSSLILLSLLGIATGLAFSTKLSAAIPTLIIYGYFLYLSLHGKTISFMHFCISTLFALIIFTSLHPPLWTHPLPWFTQLISWRTIQLTAAQSPVYAPKGVMDKLSYFLREAFTYPPLAFVALGLFAFLIFVRPTFAALSFASLLTFVLILPIKWNRYLLPVLPSLAVYLGSFPLLLQEAWHKIQPHLKQIVHFLLGGLIAAALIGLFIFVPYHLWLSVLILAITVFLTLQGYLVTRAMLYSFNRPTETTLPSKSPQHTFSLIVPARDEASVIRQTIRSLVTLRYPASLYEILVMVRADDATTLIAARRVIADTKSSNIRLIEIDGEADNKAYSLNLGLHLAKYEYLGIFDAEDEPHPDILGKINAYLLAHPTAHAVQAPVHLTNLTSNWYSGLNAVEYYFWFRSVLPFLTARGITPLGGNTIFVHKQTLKKLGGYDETCLTEDADLGVRLAAARAEVGIITDPTLATHEETPDNEIGVIRQRARWDQGYLQVLNKSTWQELSWKQQFFTLYTLTQPVFRHLSFLNMIFSPLLASLGQIPLWVALLSFLPGYFLLLQLGLYCLGLTDLAKLHNLKLTPWRYALTVLAFVPYQALLAIATTRALGKILDGNYHWDKTTHTNAHRESLAILEV